VPPQQALADAVNQSLAPPEQVTLAWLYRHVPVSLWVAFVALLAAAFITGVAVARTDIYVSIEKFFKTVL